jgi:putative DNA primase/helicase
MGKFSLNPINVPAEDFLHAFFDYHEKVCFRVFADKKGSAFSGAKLSCALEEYFNIAEALQAHNAQDRGIFFVVNFGGQSIAEISRINAQFVEMDDGTFEEQLAKVEAFPLAPSLIVKTRRSLHCYWLMQKADVARFRHIQKQLVAQFHGDPQCVDECRVLRVPGFNHCKEEPLPVECIKFNPELRYTQEQLSAALPNMPEESSTVNRQSSIKKGAQRGLALLARKCPFFKHCKKNAKTLSDPDWYAMISNLALFEGSEEVIHRLSRPHPGYSPEATDRKIAHFHKSGTRPITCQRIFEGGFQCPCVEKCSAKSPAGLAFVPATLDELKKWLSSTKELTKTGDPVADLQLAGRFIADYLFNQDPGLAEPFIRYDLRKHFDYKADDVRGLLAAYRELHGKFTSLREVKRRQNPGAAEWYETNKNGQLRLMPGVLADHLAANFHAFYCTEQYYFYENGVYQPRTEKDAKATVRTYLNVRDVTMNQINDVEGQWQLTIRKPVREINPNPFIINCQNGLYNVADDSFRNHDPWYFSTVQMKARYAPEATAPAWLAFLRSVLEPPEIHLLQEIFGYLLVPITKAQKSFILCGLPNVGKSTILTVMQEYLLGAENVSNVPLQALSERFQPAQLFGKLANIYADLPTKKIDDVGMFKAVTGEDYITGERKNKDPFPFKSFARFLQSCNDMARNYGDRSDAFYRRLIIMRFSKPVPPERHDPDLKEKLSAERDGILAWAIEGLKRLIINNYSFSETDRTRAEVKAYRVQNNSVLAFVEEYCKLIPDAVCSRREMYAEYKSYCELANIGKVSQPQFVREVAGINGVSAELDPQTRRAAFRGIEFVSTDA